MRRVITILSLLAIFLTSLFYGKQARAADDITHFYGSFFFATAAGVDKDFAAAMSVGNEMIDRGIWTNPMGLPTPRLLYHFLGTPVEFAVEGSMIKRGMAIATIKHPLFYNLLDVGMKTKDPVKLGAALHLLTDTFFHSGYSNLLGHAEGGHRPDMPYEEVQKAMLCFQSIIEVMYIIRDMQSTKPDLRIMERIISEVMLNETYAAKLKKVTGANDINEVVTVISKRPDLFTQVILDNKVIRNSFFTNIEKTDSYAKIAMGEVLNIYKEKKYTSLSSSDLMELANQFKDVSARTDIDAQQTLKIFIFRVLQLQDHVLAKIAEADLIKNGIDPDEMKSVIDKGQFDFSKLGDFDSQEGFKANIENETRKNQDALRMLVANAEIFASQISQTAADGKNELMQSHAWSQDAQTFAERVFPEVLSWIRLFNQNGNIRLTEHRDVGNLVSTQTDTDWMRNLIDQDPKFLENTIKLLKNLESNDAALAQASRLKALAEVSYHLAHATTKDLFPGKLSPIKKIVAEDDSLAHACFAKSCRVKAIEDVVAEYSGVKLLKGPDGFHTYAKNQMKTALAKMNIGKTSEAVDAQAAMLTEMVREHSFSMGHGTKDSSGRITLPSEREGLMEVAPNLNLSGYLSWTQSSAKYVFRVMAKLTKAKNKAIMEYIQNGEVAKTAVTKALHEAYYSTNSTGQLPVSWLDKYGKINLNSANYKVTGLPSSVFRCEMLFAK
jgi:hypothetical protein